MNEKKNETMLNHFLLPVTTDGLLSFKIRCHGGLRPVVRTPTSHCRGLGSLPGQGAEIPRAAQLSPKIEFRSQMKRCLLPESGGSLVARVPFPGVGVVDGAIWPAPGGEVLSSTSGACVYSPGRLSE